MDTRVIARLNAGIQRGALGIGLQMEPVATLPLRDVKHATSLRQLFASGVLRPGGIDDTAAHAIVDAGNGQALLGKVSMRRVPGDGHVSIDWPFGTRDVTGVPPQARTRLAVIADRISERITDPTYARSYGRDLNVQRTDPSLQRIIGWDNYISFDAGDAGKLRAFDMSDLPRSGAVAG